MKRTILPYVISLLLIISSQFVLSQGVELSTPEACCSAIIVEDLEKATNWYAKALRFESVSQFNNAERGIAITNMKSGGIRLELIQIGTSMDPDSLNLGSARLQGFFKFGIRVTDFDSWMSHLSPIIPGIENQVVSDPVSKKRMVVIRDPEGNRIQIFED